MDASQTTFTKKIYTISTISIWIPKISVTNLMFDQMWYMVTFSPSFCVRLNNGQRRLFIFFISAWMARKIAYGQKHVLWGHHDLSLWPKNKPNIGSEKLKIGRFWWPMFYFSVNISVLIYVSLLIQLFTTQFFQCQCFPFQFRFCFQYLLFWPHTKPIKYILTSKCKFM